MKKGEIAWKKGERPQVSWQRLPSTIKQRVLRGCCLTIETERGRKSFSLFSWYYALLMKMIPKKKDITNAIKICFHNKGMNRDLRITELLRLEMASKIIEANHKPIPTVFISKLYPYVTH